MATPTTSSSCDLAPPTPPPACVCVCVCRVCFPVQVNQLPRESQLSITLFASPLPPPAGAEERGGRRRGAEPLGWVTMPLFNFRQ